MKRKRGLEEKRKKEEKEEGRWKLRVSGDGTTLTGSIATVYDCSLKVAERETC